MKELNHPDYLFVKNILGDGACISGDHFAALREKNGKCGLWLPKYYSAAPESSKQPSCYLYWS